MEQLLGTCGIVCGKDGQGKSHLFDNQIIPQFGDNAVIYDWHGDYERNPKYKRLLKLGKIFPQPKGKEFVDYCANPDLKDHLFLFEEADNFYGRSNKNPFKIDRIKVNWILSAKGSHHNNNCVAFIYHALPQIPDDVKIFYDWFFLYDQEGAFNKVKEAWNGDKIFDAYLLHEQIYNSPNDKIRKPDGGLIKPPLIFSRTKDLPK